MKKEDKQLLLKDLCARLPYGVICQLSNKDVDISIIEKLDLGGLEHFIFGTMDVLPNLRPMSSMTKEEEEEYELLIDCSDHTYFKTSDKVIDWLNTHHFDYRGLIEKGLALEAKEGMYKTE